jgi:DNA invertase Pin-like site-specific DNA recombinase
MLAYARPGDMVIVTAIDRLGRSVAEVTRTIADLEESGIMLCALREGVDTATHGTCSNRNHDHAG